MSGPPDSDLEIFKKHIDQHGLPEHIVCPICGSRSWLIQGHYQLPASVPAPPPNVPGMPGYLLPTNVATEVMPALAVICRTCFYIRWFAYEPMRKAVQGG